MNHKFEKSLEEIKVYLKENNTPIARFVYTENDGRISSLTVPSTKIKSSTINKLIAILTIRDKLLYPDSNTLFIDPCSVQENLCVIGNFVGDTRDTLKNDQINVNTTFAFTLHNDTSLDIFHDLRNEIAIESIKAGVDITCHYTTDNCDQSFVFDSQNLLNLADSIQKMKFLVNIIVGSYGQRVDLSANHSLLRLENGKSITKSLEDNPYIFVREL